MKSRYEKTVEFVVKSVGPNRRILDLGTPNIIAELLAKQGYSVTNTDGRDLDINFSEYAAMDVEVVTAFQIFEHMLAPYNILRNIKANELVASIPLKLWFAKAYWNPVDVWDRHYHEFESKQFEMLLDRSGWEIITSAKWTSPDFKKIGFRPILRWFTKRHYIVYCKRKPNYVPAI